MPPRFQPRGRGGGPSTVPVPSAAETHVETIGARRKGYGQAGKAITVVTNHFECKIPDKVISHYDVISPDEKVLPARLNFRIIHALQTQVAPNDFSPRAVYDGRKNMFAARDLPFGKTKEYLVSLHDAHTADQRAREGKEPRGYKVRLTKVAEINPEVLSRFLLGKQSNDNNVLTAITALNVVIRMQPSLDYPFNVRSFFTDNETKDIRGGLILWRGYFQSIRPASGRMLINIDISTGTMYKAGSLMNLCLEFLNKTGQPTALSSKHGMPERERIRLQRFISSVRITSHPRPGSSASQSAPRTIKKLSKEGANALMFSLREGGQQSVAAYFHATYNKRLQYPDNLCVEVGSGALLPIEVCQVVTGQIMRRQVPPDKTKDVLEFATKKPQDRLNSITNALPVLAYGQSEYVRSFGMTVDSNGPITIKARVLPAPTLQYGRGSKQMNITPRDGAWNMVDKKFHSPCEVGAWVVVVYEREQRFTKAGAQDMVQGLSRSCADVGIKIRPEPLIQWVNPQGNISDQLRSAGIACKQKTGVLPTLIVAVLPEGATDIYTAIKHFGDITTGVATQCLKASKCFRAKPQYYANVCLKINVKLGGINTICQPSSVPYLTDNMNPTIVMGADVVHPAPGSDGRPSFTSLVANVDGHTAKYIATSRVQTSRQEMIDDLEEMVKYVLTMYKGYRERMEKVSGSPKRIIFYRDGVSEGQFKQVLEQEVPRIKKACESLGIKPMPKLTVIVVGKRHHVRFFPKTEREGDRSGNCVAGTVVDRDVTHPTENDFYLQSHGGLLGTSRPAHYSVLLDENDFQVDGLQQLSFALCHVYARSTRSVSIPAPVYYADIVCARAKNHYDPNAGMDLDETPTESVSRQQAQQNLDAFKSGFKPLHALAAKTMYFS